MNMASVPVVRHAEAASASAMLDRRAIAATVLGNALEFFDFICYTNFAVAIGHAFFGWLGRTDSGPVNTSRGSLQRQFSCSFPRDQRPISRVRVSAARDLYHGQFGRELKGFWSSRWDIGGP